MLVWNSLLTLLFLVGSSSAGRLFMRNSDGSFASELENGKGASMIDIDGKEGTQGPDVDPISRLNGEEDNSHRHSQHHHIVESQMDEDDMDVMHEMFPMIDKTGLIRFSALPDVQKELIKDIVRVIMKNDEYMKFLSYPSFPNIVKMVKKMLHGPSQSALNDQVSLKILSIIAYYKKFYEPFNNAETRQRAMQLVDHLIEATLNKTLTTEDTIRLNENKKTLAFLLQDKEFQEKIGMPEYPYRQHVVEKNNQANMTAPGKVGNASSFAEPAINASSTHGVAHPTGLNSNDLPRYLSAGHPKDPEINDSPGRPQFTENAAKNSRGFVPSPIIEDEKEKFLIGSGDGAEKSKTHEFVAVEGITKDDSSSGVTAPMDSRSSGMSTPIYSGSSGMTTGMDSDPTEMTTPMYSRPSGRTTPIYLGSSGMTTAMDYDPSGVTDPTDSGSSGMSTPMYAGFSGMTATMHSRPTGMTATIDSRSSERTTPIYSGSSGMSTPMDSGFSGMTATMDSGSSGMTTKMESGFSGMTTPMNHISTSFSPTTYPYHGTTIGSPYSTKKTVSRNIKHQEGSTVNDPGAK